MATDTFIHDFELPFQLYDVLDTKALNGTSKFAEHSRETFDAVLDTANKIATNLFCRITIWQTKRTTVWWQKVSMIDEVKVAFDAFRESGFIAGRYSFWRRRYAVAWNRDDGRGRLFYGCQSIHHRLSILTTAAINVISHFASDEIKNAFMPRMLTGEFTGTMALTEPHAGHRWLISKTIAVQQDDGSYRVKGSKIYISAGDHELSDNIVHLVLPKLQFLVVVSKVFLIRCTKNIA